MNVSTCCESSKKWKWHANCASIPKCTDKSPFRLCLQCSSFSSKSIVS
jgi:hypothetical protein